MKKKKAKRTKRVYYGRRHKEPIPKFGWIVEHNCVCKIKISYEYTERAKFVFSQFSMSTEDRESAVDRRFFVEDQREHENDPYGERYRSLTVFVHREAAIRYALFWLRADLAAIRTKISNLEEALSEGEPAKKVRHLKWEASLEEVKSAEKTRPKTKRK